MPSQQSHREEIALPPRFSDSGNLSRVREACGAAETPRVGDRVRVVGFEPLGRTARDGSRGFKNSESEMGNDQLKMQILPNLSDNQVLDTEKMVLHIPPENGPSKEGGFLHDEKRHPRTCHAMIACMPLVPSIHHQMS